MTDVITAEVNRQVAEEKAAKIRELEEEVYDAKTVDDLLEEAYNKLSVDQTQLKYEIERYFYKSGFWEEKEIPPVEETDAEGNPIDAETAVEVEEEKTGFTLTSTENV